MGRKPCCDKVGLKEGAWTAEEDRKLLNFITMHDRGHSWHEVAKLAGLLRCGKSCRLRWTNYLRPDLKRGLLSESEEKLIIDQHAAIGNRWSRIAAQLPGRTDNDIKNYWKTSIKKKLRQMGIDPVTHNPFRQMQMQSTPTENLLLQENDNQHQQELELNEPDQNQSSNGAVKTELANNDIEPLENFNMEDSNFSMEDSIRYKWSLSAGRLPGRTDNEIKHCLSSHPMKKRITMEFDPLTDRLFQKNHRHHPSATGNVREPETARSHEIVNDFFHCRSESEKVSDAASGVARDEQPHVNVNVNLELSISPPGWKEDAVVNSEREMDFLRRPSEYLSAKSEQISEAASGLAPDQHSHHNVDLNLELSISPPSIHEAAVQE